MSGTEPAENDSPSPADSLGGMPASETPADELTRRLTYLMLFRVVLITLVLGATTVLHWLSDADLGLPSALILYAIIGITYLLTIVYAVILQRGTDLVRLAYLQLAGDLVIASLLVHVTGGAQSAYTFFYPLAIIGAAVVRYRNGAIVLAIASAVAYLSISLLGWAELLPIPEGQRLLPYDMAALPLLRQLALNLAAIAAVGFLAVNLAGQLLRTSASLESHRSAAADLLTLHRDIVRSLASGLVTIRSDDTVSTINVAACEMLGIDADEALARELRAISPELADITAGLAPEGALRRGEIRRAVPDDDDRVLGVSVSPLYDHKNRVRGRVVNFQDLTEMRRMEENVKRTERLAVVGGIVAGVAHEIRNPLASISGSVELLRDRPAGGGDDSDTLMDIVIREIDRLNGLLTELLDYTNPRPLRYLEIDARELIDDTLRVFGQDPRFEQIEVRHEPAGSDALKVAADPEKLRQALWNLFRNGAEAASQGGGHLTVRTSCDDDGLVIDIEDDGPGIPAELAERIFDPFFTTKTSGTGLGLATVQNIVDDHGGELSVRSELSRGSIFTLRLPGRVEL